MKLLRRRWVRLLVLLCLLVVLVALAPGLADTEPVRRYLAARIAERLGRPVTVARVEAGWTSGVDLRGLQVGNQHAAQGEEPLLDVERVRIHDPLTQLALGDGPSRVVVEGVRLRLEGREGGRTNVDDLLARLAPRPREKPLPPPERPPVPPRPLRVELRRAAVTLHHLPYRPPARRIDPFEEDPVVRPADEGRVEVRLDPVTLLLERGAGGLRLKVDAEWRAPEAGGTLHADLRSEGGRLTGELQAAGLDLAWLAPLLPGELSGRLDVEARGDLDALHLQARIAKLRCAGPGLPELEEEQVALELEALREADGAYVARTLRLETASEETWLRASGPLGDRPGPFAVDLRAPFALLAGLTGRTPGKGIVMLEARGALDERGAAVQGVLTLTHFRLKDARQQTSGPTNLTTDFDLGWARADGEVAVRRLHLRSPEIELDLSGSARLADPTAMSLDGTGHAELSALHRFFEPLLSLDPGTRIAGTARIGRLHLLADRGGNLEADVDAELVDFRAEGLLHEDLSRERTHLRIDARLDAAGDTLTVETAQIDQLTASGTVQGLLAGDLRAADGSVRGTLPLTSLLPRLLGVEELDRLEGELQIDARAATREDRISFEGDVTARGLFAEGRFGLLRQEALALTGRATGSGREWSGSLEARGDGWGTTVEAEDLGRAKVVFSCEDAGRLPLLELPPGWELAGPASGRVDLRREEGAWSAEGLLDSPALTARRGESGLGGERVELRLAASQARDGWTFDVPSGRIHERGIRFQVTGGFIGADGSLGGRLECSGPLERQPELSRYGARGAARMTARVTREQDWSVEAGLGVNGFEAQLGGQVRSVGRLDLDLAASAAGNGVTLESFALDADGATCAGRAVVGERIEAEITLETPAERLEQWLPEIDGTGRAVFEGALSLPRPGSDGALRVRGTLRAADLRFEDLRLARPDAEVLVEGRLHGADLLDLSSTVVVRAASASAGAIRMAEPTFQQTGRGAWKRGGDRTDYRFRVQVRAKEILADTLPFQGAELNVQGATGRSVFREPGGTEATGMLGFQRLLVNGTEFRDGAAQVRLERRTLHVEDFTALATEGAVGGTVQLDFAESPLAWRAHLTASNLKLSERLGRPLGLVVPILRLKRGVRERQLVGWLGLDLDLAGRGTTLSDLQRTLAGRGRFELADVTVKGSVLLPLLSLRIDKLVRGQGYRFRTVRVRFEVSEGHVRPAPFKVEGVPFSIEVSGEAGLDGHLDFLVQPNLMPFPLRIKGGFDDPKVRPAPFAGLR